MSLFPKKLAPRLHEIHEYTLDLQRVSLLRDKCAYAKERETYDHAIHIMQEVLIYLNSKVLK
jgi:hypothetical protein